MKGIAGRVALVTRPDAGTWSTTAANLNGLRGRGWDARLVEIRCRVPAARTAAVLSLARAAARSGAVAWRARKGGWRGRESVWCRREIAGRLIGLAPAVLHFDSTRLAADWLPLVESMGCPLVVGVTADDLYGAGSGPFEGSADVWARTAAVHVPDAALEQRALQRGCPPHLPRAVVAPAVDTELFAPGDESARPGSARPLRVVSAGVLDWMQGLEHAIHAMRLLREAGVECEYTIAGAGDYLPALTFARHQLGVSDEVEFPGPLTPRELLDLLRSADVFLSASVVDGLSQELLEALACGTPVVTSDPGSLGDSAIDTRAAVVVRRRDPRALADALATLARDESLRRDMGRAARDWALEHLSASRRLELLDGLLRQAV